MCMGAAIRAMSILKTTFHMGFENENPEKLVIMSVYPNI